MADWIKRFSLQGKAALVTGASKGIGFEICRVLADAGADIAAVARDTKGLEDVHAEVTALGRKCEKIVADLADPDACIAAARKALAAFGTIDILVNNAGIALNNPILKSTLADWDMTMAVNLRAPYLLAKELAPKMIAQKSGKIVNVSSQTGVVALQDHAAYASSKAGLNALTKSMTCEWAKHNIQVNAVCPTIIMTPMGQQVWGEPAKSQPMLDRTPLGRFGTTTEVADTVLFLSSTASDLVNGDTIMVEGGYTSL